MIKLSNEHHRLQHIQIALEFFFFFCVKVSGKKAGLLQKLKAIYPEAFIEVWGQSLAELILVD